MNCREHVKNKQEIEQPQKATESEKIGFSFFSKANVKKKGKNAKKRWLDTQTQNPLNFS